MQTHNVDVACGAGFSVSDNDETLEAGKLRIQHNGRGTLAVR
jgi:hypothetical protein